VYKQITTLIAIGAIVLFYIMALIEYVRPVTFGSEYSESYKLLSFANVIALITLLINGTLIDSQKFKIIKIAIGVTILGAILKIIHMPGGNETLAVGSAGITITYVLHFSSKARKAILDILKLLTVLLLIMPFAFVSYYRTASYDMRLAGDLLCVITFTYFLFTERDRYLTNPDS
jgi:hypothetical protein